MTKPRLTYFDAPVSRGEECRLALHLGGLDFEDNRVNNTEWPTLKPQTPYGGLPTLEVPGFGMLAQSNAILVFVGRRTGLHPTDDYEAARHEAMMCHVEDLRGVLTPTMRIADESLRKAAREEIASTVLPTWAASAEAQLGDGPFFAGAKLHVVDLKLHMIVRWLSSGRFDHIAPTIFAPYERLNRVHDAVRDDPRVRAWYSRTS